MEQYFSQLLERVRGYPPLEVAAEFALIWVVVLLVISYLRGTRGAGMFKAFALLLIFSTLMVRLLSGRGEHFQRLNFLYDKALTFAAIALIVVFQPELRRALIRLGEAGFSRFTRAEVLPVIDAIVEACTFNAKNRFGVLIAIERNTSLGGLVEGGVRLDAEVSARLLQSIFWPNSALHDLGVVIRGNKVLAANVQFPLAEAGDFSHDLGSRHRAAVGLTLESDALVVVVSEETGVISLAERGRLTRHLSGEELRRCLTDRLLKRRDRRESAAEPEADPLPAVDSQRAFEPAPIGRSETNPANEATGEQPAVTPARTAIDA